jgi:hypothetical protein
MHFFALLLLLPGQIHDEIPERLPPPPDFLSPATDFRTSPGWSSPPFLPDQLLPDQPIGIGIQSQAPPPNDSPPYSPPLEPPAPGGTLLADITGGEELPLPGTRWTLTTLGAGSDFGATTIDVNHTWLLGYGEAPPLNITPGFAVHWWNDPVGLGLPPRVYDLYLDFLWTPWTTDRWSVAAGLTPGFYSDFQQFGSKTFQLTGWLVANRRFDPHWQLLFGVAYVRQLQSNLIPVGGVIWTPNDNVRLEAIIPKPKYAVRFRETATGSLWWFLAGQLGGGSWAVADGPQNSAFVSYTDLRILCGVESFRMDGREWTVEVGYVFNRNIYIDNLHVATPNNSFSLTAAFAY